MFEFIAKLFDSENFMPHGQCLLWEPEVLWLHVISDVIITLSYFSIPCIILYVIKKRGGIAFKLVYIMFGLFIFLCGLTHLISVWTLWNPVYRFEGLIKAFTAIVSMATALLLVPIIPLIFEIIDKGENNSDK